MALDTTIGTNTADSMITLDEFAAFLDTYHAGDPAIAQWEALDISLQEGLARLSAQFFFYFPLRGEKVYTDPEQSMPFPRTSQKDTTVIPQAIKDTQAEILFNIILRSYLSKTSPSEGSSSTAQVKKLGLGGLLSIEFAEKGDNSGSFLEQFTRSVNSMAWLRLRPYVTQIRGASI